MKFVKVEGPEYICKRWRMYDWLISRSWKPDRIITDVHKPHFVNWIFKTSPEFNKDVELYFDMLSKKHETKN